MTLIDNRSSVQVAASEGSASKTDWGGFGALFGGGGAAGLGGYVNTPQGKVIAAAFMDAYNQMVRFSSRCEKSHSQLFGVRTPAPKRHYGTQSTHSN